MLQLVLSVALFMGSYGLSQNPYLCFYENSHRSCDDGDTFNGFWHADGWVPGHASLESWFTPAPAYSVGAAVFYDPGPMEATAEYRGLSLDGYLGGVALMSPADIGLTVYLRKPGGVFEGPYKVVDAAAQNHIWTNVLHRYEVIEIDYHLAEKWGMIGKTAKDTIYRLDGVEVLKIDPRVLPRGTCPVDYPRWWLALVEPTTHKYLESPLTEGGEWRLNGTWIRFSQPTLLDLWREQIMYREFLSCSTWTPPRAGGDN